MLYRAFLVLDHTFESPSGDMTRCARPTILDPDAICGKHSRLHVVAMPDRMHGNYHAIDPHAPAPNFQRSLGRTVTLTGNGGNVCGLCGCYVRAPWHLGMLDLKEVPTVVHAFNEVDGTESCGRCTWPLEAPWHTYSMAPALSGVRGHEAKQYHVHRSRQQTYNRQWMVAFYSGGADILSALGPEGYRCEDCHAGIGEPCRREEMVAAYVTVAPAPATPEPVEPTIDPRPITGNESVDQWTATVWQQHTEDQYGECTCGMVWPCERRMMAALMIDMAKRLTMLTPDQAVLLPQREQRSLEFEDNGHDYMGWKQSEEARS